MDEKFSSINDRIFLFRKRLRDEALWEKFCNTKNFSIVEELKKIKEK